MTSQHRLAGYVFAALGAAFFSTKAIFIKLAYAEQVDAALMLAYRMIFAMPVFAAIGVWAWLQRQANGEPPPSARDVARAAFVGFLGYYVASQFDFAGLMFITAQLERLVLFTYPLFVMFLGALLYGERITGSGVLAALITYAGLAIVFVLDLPEGGRDTAIGTLLVLGAAISFALHQIYAKRFMAPIGSALFTAIALCSASVFCTLHQWIVGAGNFAASPRFLWLSAGCAIVATVLPTFLINAGLARISSAAVSMISTVSPVVTIALAVWILDETFTFADAIGSTMVLAGVGLYAWGENRQRA
jgi:drug/metabolite transporter (DMT)-like permease